jgi:RNA-directed DNA polymerase
MPSSSPTRAEIAAKPYADDNALLLDGRPIVTAYDAANYFNVSVGKLTHALYRAPEQQRYKSFAIPKRTGGLRPILAPIGLTRELQEKLAPILQARYSAHPAAQGFIKERSILSNARVHAGQRLVLNIDLEEFFPSINFGRVRGLFMAEPFRLGPAAASLFAQLCAYRNGLPQGAPTSPALSNFIAADLDRRLARLARESNVRYTRYADDITFSSNQQTLPQTLIVSGHAGSGSGVQVAEPLERAITASGFAINQKKVRLQTRHQRQSVTGLNVNSKANVTRARIRQLRAMLHAWEKFGIGPAAREHFIKHRGMLKLPNDPPRAYRDVVYGQLAFIKMVRGADDPVFLNLAAKLIAIDPNPSRFVRQMAFGGDDYDVFISHASEDKDAIARPIFEACAKLGVKAFLDEAHIGWGQSFTTKINTALGSARTVLAIVSQVSVTKEWPVVEVNTALSFEVTGQKKVVPLLVGKPDLTRLPLIQGKDAMSWNGDAMAVAKRLKAAKDGAAPRKPAATQTAGAGRPGPWSAPPPVIAPAPPPKPKGGFFGLFGPKKPK